MDSRNELTSSSYFAFLFAITPHFSLAVGAAGIVAPRTSPGAESCTYKCPRPEEFFVLEYFDTVNGVTYCNLEHDEFPLYTYQCNYDSVCF